MIEIRIVHALGREVARSRFESLAKAKGTEIQPSADGFSGMVEKALPFLGRVRGSFVIGSEVVVVSVLEAPPFLSEATLRRLVEDELARAFA